ncbi:universal stress protein [Lacinutrix neustonica]|uniref:Universal stress protein n=1 Tax=Lacinutrix neustonica TaxID=2980107 RepID=A0A9E8SCR0_9FLAO|nr:universal stress protein [Lacinutrix neustonica]WAC01266.1 universal stress protein [Lacinutrix neustonica]
MKNILLPISFSETSKNALYCANLIAKEHGATLSLLHCYSGYEYNREHDFGALGYDEGVRRMLKTFYTKNISSIERQPIILLACEGSVSDNISEISHEYELLVLSRRTGDLSISKIGFSDKLFYLTTKSPCPVLLLPSNRAVYSFSEVKNIWHIQRKDIETDLVKLQLLNLNINPNLVKSKSLQQETFLSLFWQNIVNYAKNPIDSELKRITESYASEHIDLLILVNHRKGIFENFLKDDTFRIISQFDIPILVLQSNK